MINAKYMKIACLPDLVLNTMIEQTEYQMALAQHHRRQDMLEGLSDAVMDLISEQCYRALLIQKGMN